MINQEYIDKYLISKSGIALSDNIMSYIVDEFSTNKPNSESIVNQDDAYLCFNKYGRGSTYKMNKCIERGIKDYITQYAIIDLVSYGISEPQIPAIPPAVSPYIVVGEDYNLKHSGYISFNDISPYNKLCTTFSINRITGIGIPTNAELNSDPSIVIKNFMNDIISWLGFNPAKNGKKLNMLSVDSSGFEKETMIVGGGSILFTATKSDIETIIGDVIKNLAILNSDDMDLFISKNIHIDNYFEIVWAIICTGLCKFLNKNEVTTFDNGYSVYNNSVYTYDGISTGIAIFGETPVQHITLELVKELPTPINKSVGITHTIKLKDINITVDGEDYNGNKKKFVFPLIFSKMKIVISEFSESMSAIMEDIGNVVNKMFDKIIELFIRLGYTVEKIMEYIIVVAKKVGEIIQNIFTAIGDMLEIVFKQLKKFLMSIFIRPARSAVWSTTESSYPATAGYRKSKNMANDVQSKLNAYEAKKSKVGTHNKVVGSISETIEKLKKKIGRVNDVAKTLGQGFCYKCDIPGIPNVPDVLPNVPEEKYTIPKAEDIPDVPVPLSKVESDDIEYDEEGNIINEPLVIGVCNEAVDGVLQGKQPSPPKSPELKQPQQSYVEDKYNKYVKTTTPTGFKSSSNFVDVKTLKTSAAMKKHIKGYEKLTLTIYLDPDGKHADIGYGHVLGLWKNRSKLKQSVTLAEAESYFTNDIIACENVVKRLVHRPITQGQFDAFVDIVYNAGRGKFAESTLLKWFNQGRVCDCGELYKRCMITSDGEILSGLKTRRLKGYAFYINGITCGV